MECMETKGPEKKLLAYVQCTNDQRQNSTASAFIID